MNKLTQRLVPLFMSQMTKVGYTQALTYRTAVRSFSAYNNGKQYSKYPPKDSENQGASMLVCHNRNI